MRETALLRKNGTKDITDVIHCSVGVPGGEVVRPTSWSCRIETLTDLQGSAQGLGVGIVAYAK